MLLSVGRHCEIADEWLTRGARNEIHICDSYMNGSSEREVISRRYADTKLDLFQEKSFDCFAAVLNHNKLDSFAVAQNDD